FEIISQAFGIFLVFLSRQCALQALGFSLESAVLALFTIQSQLSLLLSLGGAHAPAVLQGRTVASHSLVFALEAGRTPGRDLSRSGVRSAACCTQLRSRFPFPEPMYDNPHSTVPAAQAGTRFRPRRVDRQVQPRGAQARKAARPPRPGSPDRRSHRRR